MNKDTEHTIKLFGMTNQIINEDLKEIEKKYDLELNHTIDNKTEIDERYYSQFDRKVRMEAKSMAQHYELFYCLEMSIRQLIEETLEAAEKEDWWNSGRIPEKIHNDVGSRITREIDSGMTRRSMEEIDYTTFGELAGIITANWDLFGSVLTSKKAVERIIGNLNSLRGPIAHCSPLAEDEILRLHLSLRDWFRQME